MRIGVFGGTFDPVHLGHLVTAEQCREQAGLDQVWFIPAARPPHKPSHHLTPFERRAEMLRLATAGHPAFRVSEIENERTGPSYTVDTLEELRRRHPDAELHLILGSDTLPDLPTWHESFRLPQLATLLLVARPGTPLPDPAGLRAVLGLAPDDPLQFQGIEVPLQEISSRDLRRRVAEGRGIRYLVPRAVEQYIVEKSLYRQPR
jgi:nicotinate-nucleotide adenylyltransferase